MEAIKGQKTSNEIASEYGVHPSQIAQWKKQALDGLPELFSTRASERRQSEEALIANLYQEIGQLKVRFTRFCGGPKHSDSPINCSHAPRLTEPSEESPLAGWPLLLGSFAQAQTKEICHRAYLQASNRHFIVWHETRRGIT